VTGPTLTLTTVQEDAMTASAAPPAPAPDLSADPAANRAALVVGGIGAGTSHRCGRLRVVLDLKVAGPAAAARPAAAGRERA